MTPAAADSSLPSGDVPPKDEVLGRAAREYKAFHEAVRGLNEAQLTEAWLGSWSVKDIAAHLAGWHREMGRALERLARGERPVPDGVSYDDVDAWNARFVAAAHDTPVTDVLLELDRSHEYFMQAAQSVPAASFRPGTAASRIVEQAGPHHSREHAEQIRSWRRARRV